MTLKRQHNHPNPGPVVVVHFRHDGPLSEDNPAHAFGPFPSEDDAMAWETAHNDECHRIILDVFDPYEWTGQ